MKCQLCNKEYKSLQGLGCHISKKHTMPLEDYYDKFISKQEKPKCKICNKPVKFKNFSKGYLTYCSKKCVAKDKKLMNEKIKKIKETNLKKYGIEWASKSDIVKEKIKQTCLTKYGTNSYMSTDDFRERSKETVIEKYGVDNVAKSDIVKEKMKCTLIERYGVDNNLKLIDRKKGNETKIKNYYSKYVDILNSKNIEVLSNKDDFVNKNTMKYKCKVCSHEWELEFENNSHYILARYNVCPNCSKSNYSKGEKELLDFVKSIIDDKVINNKFFVVKDKKYELDIYAPSKNIGIEFNGIYWHSSKFKDPNYHFDKTNFFKDNFNIDVIHINEYVWAYKKDIVKNIISNRLCKNNQRIYARNTIKKELSVEEYRNFVNKFHIQGYVNSKHKIGLFYDGELVSAVGIGKGRFEDTNELLRYVTKSNITVVGGLSKLLKGFDNLVSYCHRDYFNGEGYKAAGFELINILQPGLFYVKNELIYNRYSLQKHKLKDWKYYDENLTGAEILELNGYLKYRDSGMLKFFKTN